MDEVTRLENQIHGTMAEAERLKREVPPDRSDSESRLSQLNTEIREGNREIAALESYRRGQEGWWPRGPSS